MLQKNMDFNNQIVWMFFRCRPFDAWIAAQKKLREYRQANKIPQFIVMATHPPCFSLGDGETIEPEKNFKVPLERSGAQLSCQSIPVFFTNRGGAATYHSPGILGCYTIFAHLPLTIADYFLIYEHTFRDIFASFELQPSRHNPHAPEMWIDDKKITSVGILFSGPISNTISYGFNLNVGGDLSPFSLIYPCGRRDEYQKTTSLETELRRHIDMGKVAEQMVKKIIFYTRQIIKEKSP